ncbi:MAG: response regulator [Halioglobus sp.]|nr:response regulator [Halioglobus sp.]
MAQNIDPPMMLRGPEQFVRANTAFCEATGLTAAELSSQELLEWIVPSDQSLVKSIIKSAPKESFRVRHQTSNGNSIPLDLRVKTTPAGNVVLGRVADSDEAMHPYVTEFDEGTVSGTLETIARIVESQNANYKCSILLVDQNRFVRGAGPSLPEEYNDAIDGEAIGPTVGSCGTAIFWNIPVIVSDIQADPLWQKLAPLAEKAGVAACWSHPFTSSSGEVLGALALYAAQPESPTTDQLERLRSAALMTGLAVERGRAEEALREQRKREAELEEQLRQVAKMEALGALAGGIAHDFNNLLAAINGNAELALMNLSENDPTRDLIDSIVVTSQRAAGFCSQMLTYAGKGTIKLEHIEFGQLLTEVSDLVQAGISKKIQLHYSLYDKPIHVHGDENQLLQVILNLITNAAEAIGDDEGVIDIATIGAHYDRATLQLLAPDMSLPSGEYIRIKISDTGCGMSKETKSKVFDPFFSTKFTGRGLGLASVTGIIRKHKGIISVSSTLGVGTTFTILLPTVAAPPAQYDSSQRNIAATGAARKILVVDDETELRTVFRHILERNGFQVVEAKDGEDALVKFSLDCDSFDCVLLDLSMPKLSGGEVFHKLRELKEDIPVVVISGYSEQDILDRLDGAPIAGTLRKPVPAATLVDAIGRAALDARQK